MFNSIKFIEFTEGQTRLLYDIRNDPMVRKYMLNSEIISYEDHQQWVNNNLLADKKVLVFFVECDGKIVGFTSLKRIGTKSAELGIIIKATEQYGGLGSICSVLLGDIAFKELHLDRLYIKSLKSHKNAIKNTIKLGGTEIQSDNPDERMFVLDEKDCGVTSPFHEIILEKFKPLLLVEWQNETAEKWN